MKLKMSCCFTGHRPEKLAWKKDEYDEACLRLKKELLLYITKLIELGVCRFYTGMAMGVDIWAAEIVLDMKNKYRDKNIQLIATIPYEEQAKNWTDEWKERYTNVLEFADKIILLQEQYTRGCFYARNRYMVDNSSFVIVVFNGEEGGTKYTIDYAKKKGLRIKILDPREYV